MANTLNLGSGNWGVKDSSLLGYKNRQNGRFIPETFDVARGSAGTRVNQSGLIETPEEILSADLVTNGDFTTDSDWTKGTGWTISSGSANCDGSQTGTTSLTPSLNNVVNNVTYIVEYTISNYSSGSISIKLGNTGYGAVRTANGTYTEKIKAQATTFPRSQINADATFVGSIDNVSVKEVNRENLARIDYLDDAAGVLLTEPQRTNLVANSTTGLYGNSPASVANTTAPDGSNNGLILIPNAEADRWEYNISGGTYATGTELTYSWYRKRITTPTGASRVGDVDQLGVNISFIGSTTQTQSDINGYDRFESVFSIVDGSATAILRMYFGNVIGIGNSSVAYWGHQLEEGSYSTSLIPTEGVAATRLADVVNNAGDVNNFNSEEGTLFAEISALSSQAVQSSYITISDGTYNNRASILFSINATNSIRTFLRVGGVTQVDLTNDVNDVQAFNKIAFSYKENDFKVYINGVLSKIDTSGLVWSANTITKLSFSEINTSAAPFFGKTKNIQVFDTALSDAELQTLTTI